MRNPIPLVLAAAPLLATACFADVVTLSPRKDATMYSDAPDRANALGAGLFIGTTTSGFFRRTLIAFDIAGAVPAGSTINSVTMRLSVTRSHGSATPADLHRLSADWGEVFAFAPEPGGNGTTAGTGDVTWTERFFDQSQPWTNVGGDFASSVSSSVTVGSGAVTWPSTTQFVADAQSMLDAPGANFGWILIGDEVHPGNARRLGSRENPTASVRPSMTINYTIPAPGALSLAGPVGALALRRRRRR